MATPKHAGEPLLSSGIFPARVFSHRPELMARWGKMLAEIKRSVEHKRFELIAFVAAIELRNQSCSLAHGKMLAQLIARDASQVREADVDALINHHGIADRELFDIAAMLPGVIPQQSRCD